MELTCTVNPYIPVTRQRHLVYVLVEIDPGTNAGGQPAALNLGLIVGASQSMAIPILTDDQFRELSSRGMARQKTADGVKIWQFDVPRGFKLEAPSNMDFTVQALHAAARRLRHGDRYSLVAFAEDTLLMVANSPGWTRSTWGTRRTWRTAWRWDTSRPWQERRPTGSAG